MKETLLKLQTETIYAAMVGGMKLPDPVLAELLRRFRSLSATLAGEDMDENTAMLLEELEAFFREDPAMSGALKRMLLEGRPSQIKSMIRGYLVNYVYDW